MPQTANFAQAAMRHLVDASALFGAQRFDNAVYLAGYAAECSLKQRLVDVLPGTKARDDGHDLVTLALAWDVAVSGDPRSEAILQQIRNGDLSDGHPVRRYWPNHWSSEAAHPILLTARATVERAVIQPAIDAGDAWPEG